MNTLHYIQWVLFWTVTYAVLPVAFAWVLQRWLDAGKPALVKGAAYAIIWGAALYPLIVGLLFVLSFHVNSKLLGHWQQDFEPDPKNALCYAMNAVVVTAMEWFPIALAFSLTFAVKNVRRVGRVKLLTGLIGTWCISFVAFFACLIMMPD